MDIDIARVAYDDFVTRKEQIEVDLKELNHKMEKAERAMRILLASMEARNDG